MPTRTGLPWLDLRGAGYLQALPLFGAIGGRLSLRTLPPFVEAGPDIAVWWIAPGEDGGVGVFGGGHIRICPVPFGPGVHVAVYGVADAWIPLSGEGLNRDDPTSPAWVFGAGLAIRDVGEASIFIELGVQHIHGISDPMILPELRVGASF